MPGRYERFETELDQRGLEQMEVNIASQFASHRIANLQTLSQRSPADALIAVMDARLAYVLGGDEKRAAIAEKPIVLQARAILAAARGHEELLDLKKYVFGRSFKHPLHVAVNGLRGLRRSPLYHEFDVVPDDMQRRLPRKG